MNGLLDTVAGLPAETPLFAAANRTITAGHIRRTATDICEQYSGNGPLFLHTASAALFVAGLLAASRKYLTVCFPAHLQPHYLREIGADGGTLLTDQNVNIAGAMPIVLASEEEQGIMDAQARDLDLIFFTSGVTGTPKQVPKKISQLDCEAQTLEQVWGKQAGSTFATVSHQHIYGMLFRVFWPVLSGRVSEDRAAEYWESLAGKLMPGTTLVSSPAHLTRLPDSVLEGSRPSLIFSAGAPLPLAAAQEALRLLGTLPIEALGSTETGGIGWRQQDREDALWTPLPGVRVEVDEDGLMGVISPFSGSVLPIATGDAVEHVSQKFRLKGRVDRVVKIDGKRVSLSRVEEALLAQPMVEAAAAIDLPSRKGTLGAIIELNAVGQAALREEGAFRLSRRLRIALAPLLEPGERPKHWRFETIPSNSQGKRVQASLRACFDREVPSDGRVITQLGDSAEIALALPPDLIWFEGHFPGQPVMPGIAQVHLAAQWAEHLWSWKPQGANLSQLKFRQIIRPGDTVHLKLTRDMAKERLIFAYEIGDIVASQGMIGGRA